MRRTRRRLLQATGLTLAGGLAGCSGDRGAGTTEDEDTAAPTDTPTEAEMTDGEMTEGMDTETPTEEETTAGTETATDTETPTPEPTQSVAVTLNNVGASAWELTEDGSGELGPMGEENPTLTFAVGTRYEVANNGWSFHPLAFRAADDTPLLSQDADGQYEDDPEVNWVDNEETLAFTVTEDLVADLDYYICTVHSSMRGDATTQ